MHAFHHILSKNIHVSTEYSSKLSTLQEVVNTFLLNPKCTHISYFYSLRLELMSVLTGYSLFASNALTSNNCTIAAATVNIENNPLLFYCVSSFSHLHSELSLIVCTIIQIAAQPSASMKLRKAAVEISEKVFTLMKPVRSDGAIRINSFQSQKVNFDLAKKQCILSVNSDQGATDGDTSSLVSRSLVLSSYRDCEYWQQCIQTLGVEIIHDSCDAVRLCVMNALTSACFAGLISGDTMSNNNSHDSFSAYRYSGIINLLINDINSCISSESNDLIIALECLLKALAVLDPIKFESILREKMDSTLNSLSDENNKIVVKEFFSSLVNHCDILKQFS
jgi:hypothetical protein